MDATDRHIRVDAARSGRPSTRDRTYRPDELVRDEIRMPASVAADLFARARDAHQPVSRTASDLLALALDLANGDAISYSQIVRASLKLERAARDGLTIEDPGNPGHSVTLHLDEVMSYICSVAIPTGMITTSTVAADGTDFESPARRDERVNKDTGEIRRAPTRTPSSGTEPPPQATPTPGTSGKKSRLSPMPLIGPSERDQVQPHRPSTWPPASARPAGTAVASPLGSSCGATGASPSMSASLIEASAKALTRTSQDPCGRPASAW